MKPGLALWLEGLLPVLVTMGLLTAALLAVYLIAEPAVRTRPRTPAEYIAVKRGDIMTTGSLSLATRETISVAGLSEGPCAEVTEACIAALAASPGIDEEKRQSALAELWTAHALSLQSRPRADNAALFDAWMETALHSYAYLFFTERTSSDRSFEERQTQVRDYYNLAAEQGSQILFEMVKHTPRTGPEEHISLGGWNVRVDLAGIRFPGNAGRPSELIPASSLSFAGLRSIYRRDGLGAELLAVTPFAPVSVGSTAQPLKFGSPLLPSRWGVGEWSEMSSPVITVIIQFPGDDLAQVLSTRNVKLSLLDPYRHASVQLRGYSVPLAANFSAGYGLWLARSGFRQRSFENLFGRTGAIDKPGLFLVQPFDPDRRIVLLLHGLGSSPDAWANVANELMGDEVLRRNFQIWQIYYPTNAPVVLNHYAIRQTLQSVLHHFDPEGKSAASHGMVLVGHSMGGMIARLMVSSSGDALVRMVRDDHHLDDASMQRLLASVSPALLFEPIPNVGRVVFLATPHRGTDAAGSWLGRRFAAFVHVPAELAKGTAQLLVPPGVAPKRRSRDLANSVRNLDKRSPFIRALVDLPIAQAVPCHSIIARADADGPLEQSSDGYVPYWSSHLPSAVSELVVRSDHSLQGAAHSIIELRRILHQDLREKPLSSARSVEGASTDGGQLHCPARNL